jgi:hypothetical protein
MRPHRLAGVAAAALVLAATFGFSASARAATPTTLYVDRNPSVCSDAGTGTASQPYCTISAALGVVTSGQTVKVAGGDYPEHVTIATSGVSLEPATPLGPFPATPAVRLTGAAAGLTIDGQHDVSVTGIRIDAADGLAAADLANSTHLTLTTVLGACPATPSSLGLRLRAVTDSVLTDSAGCAATLDAASSGVSLKALRGVGYYRKSGPGVDIAGSHNTVTGSWFSSGPKGFTTVALEPGAAGNVVADNTILEDGGVAIANDGATGTALTNNTVMMTCGSGIRVSGASTGVSVENNLLEEQSPQSGCAAGGVNLGVYDGAVGQTAVDYNSHTALVAGRYPYAWPAPMTLAAFRAASGQGAHDSDGGLDTRIDSADSAAPGYQSLDRNGRFREDNPVVSDTGHGTVSYADRGSDEAVRGPAVALDFGIGANGMSIKADASGTSPGWAPIASYTFAFGDGTSVTQATPVANHQYTKGGEYAVQVTVTDTNRVAISTSVTRSVWPVLRSVALLASLNHSYVTAASPYMSSGTLAAGANVAANWERFDLVQPDSTHVALRSRANGKYVENVTGGDGTLWAHLNTTTNATLFTLVHNADGSISLAQDGKYVSMRDELYGRLTVTATAIDVTESFYLVDLPNLSVSLKAHANGRYVTAEAAGAKPLIANRTAVGTWELFDLVDVGNGKVALLSHANGWFVTAEAAGAQPLIANRFFARAWERFTVVANADGSISLIAAADNRYVTAESAGAKPLIANRTAIGAWEKFDRATH